MEAMSYSDTCRPQVKLWDMPGAGTVAHSARKYFDEKALYAFDALIVVVSRMTAVDACIIDTAVRVYGLPVAVLRTKADQDLPKLMRDAAMQRMRTPSRASSRHQQYGINTNAIAKRQSAQRRQTSVKPNKKDEDVALASVIQQHAADVEGKCCFTIMCMMICFMTLRLTEAAVAMQGSF